MGSLIAWQKHCARMILKRPNVVKKSDILGEFEQIAQIMAPLAEQVEGAFALGDDGAVFSHAPDQEIVVTTDTLIAGVHFFETDPPEDIARKLLGVNLSDLAAMGAKPLHYTLNASYPKDITTQWISAFASGLKVMQDKYDISLLGGDTTGTSGPLVLSLSAFGLVEKGQALRRNGARAGDLLCVSGTIGDSALGLNVAKGEITDETGHLLERYQHPQPRIKLGLGLHKIARACLDVSDGLLADLTHLCKQSGCGADVHIQKIPLSKAARICLTKDSSNLSTVLTGGDDYELLFSIPKTHQEKLCQISAETQTEIHIIGSISASLGIRLHQDDGTLFKPQSIGYRHF